MYVNKPLPDPASKMVVLITVAITSFFTPFMLSAVNIAAPSIGREFSMDAIMLSWIPNSFLLASTICLVPFGRIADMYGRKKIFLIGVIAFSLMSGIQALAASGMMFLVFRVLQGIGGSMVFVTGVAIISSTFAPEERGKALGLSAACVYLGISIGPFIGGLLTSSVGWRSIFLIPVPLGLGIAVATVLKIKSEWAAEIKGSFDFIGSILYGVSMLALIYGISLLPNLYAIWVIAAGLVGLVIFVFWEIRAEYPVLQVKLFAKNRVLVFSSLAALVNFSATYAIIFLISLYLQYIQGRSAFQSGLIMMSMPALQAIFSPVAGRMSDKVEPRVLSSVGMGICTVGLVMLAFLGPDTPLSLLLLYLVIMGLGTAFFAAPNTNAAMSSVQSRWFGTASAILSTMRQTGGILSIGIVMMLFALFIGRVEITQEYYPQFITSLRASFSISSVLCFAGMFMSMARGRAHHHSPSL